jgi:hypothetical protein
MTRKVETTSLKLLCDVQKELREALNSLGGKQSGGLLEHYLFYMAVHINRAAEGYVFLRQASRLDASRLLIRPAIEAMIRILAIRKDPSLLYRIAYTERMEDRKWVRPSAIRAGRNYDAEDEKEWMEFTKKYTAEFPAHRLEEKELRLREAATTADAESYYDSHYRLYCRFTHAAFGAATGSLDDTHAEDNEAMAACAYCGLDAVASFGGGAPNLVSLGNRLMGEGKSGN